MAQFIERTFQLIKGVGDFREKSLWAEKIFTWNDFLLAQSKRTVMSKRLDRDLALAIEVAKSSLEQRDLSALAAMLSPKHAYRLYSAFSERAAFFDIEADGDDTPTVIGVMDSGGVATFRRGHSLAVAPQRLQQSQIWVSFNGSVYDVPALQKHFKEAFTKPLLHIDIRFLLKHAHLKGGLKSVERELGLHRPPHVQGINGLQAIALWRHYNATKDLKALRILTEYNLYDVINLRTILEWTLWQMERPFDVEKPHIFDRGDVLYDVSKLLLSL
jgi:uncharacterized protein